MDATYGSATTFEVAGDQTAIFVTGRRVKCDCGVDGYKYGTISGSVFDNPNSTITLKEDSDELTNNLISIEWSAVTPNSAVDSTYTKTLRIMVSKLGKNVTNPPTVVEFGITHALKFTVNTDAVYLKQAIESDYDSGNLLLHFHWTKSTVNSNQSGKNVKWQIKYLVINGTSENCNTGESILSVEDSYDSAVEATQIVYETDNIIIPAAGFVAHDMIIMEVKAVTPVGTPLSDEPALLYVDIVYTAKHRPS